MNLNFQITVPTLIGSQYFKTRYRLLPAGAWSAVTNRTNAPFTITGLAAGSYELEAILVLEDATECAATFWPFTVVTPVECIDFNVEIIQASNGQYFLQITYVPTYNPPCGWNITHINGTTKFATLPASPILIPTQNVTQRVTIEADGCYANKKDCYDEDVPSIEPVCVPMTILSDELQVNGTTSNGFKTMTLKLTYSQSTPTTPFITVGINQINVLNNGQTFPVSYPNFGFGPIPTTGTPSITFSILMNNNVAGSLYEVNWFIVDGCGVKHSGYASILL